MRRGVPTCELRRLILDCLPYIPQSGHEGRGPPTPAVRRLDCRVWTPRGPAGGAPARQRASYLYILRFVTASHL
eukprot:2165842-Prymnesium_polylepis.1